MRQQDSTRSRWRDPLVAVSAVALAALAVVIGVAMLRTSTDQADSAEPAEPTVAQAGEAGDSVPSPTIEISATVVEVEAVPATFEVLFAPSCTTRHYQAPVGAEVGGDSVGFGACTADPPDAGSELGQASHGIRLAVREASSLDETVASLASDERWLSLEQIESTVAGRRTVRLEGSLQRADSDSAQVVIEAIGAGEATLSVVAVDDAPMSEVWRNNLSFSEIRAVQSALLQEIELFAVECGVPQNYHEVDFDGDGTPEWLGSTLRRDRMHRVEVLRATPGEPCAYTVAAEGQAFGSAGSPQGFGCANLAPDRTFVDWQVSGSAQLSSNGADAMAYTVETVRTTSFLGPEPATETATILRESRDTETGGFRYPCLSTEVEGFTSQGTAWSVSSPVSSCRNDHWYLDVPGDGEWFTHDLPQSFVERGSDRRCTYFTLEAWGISLQCDCVPAVTIEFSDGAQGQDREPTSDVADGSTLVSETVTSVDGYPAVLTRTELADDGLYGDHTRYTYAVDVGSAGLSITASDAEFDDLEAAIELADQIASVIEIRNVAPPDRVCAQVPEHHEAFPVVYHDFDGDGIDEALVATDPAIDEANLSVQLTHRVLRSDGACGWVDVQGEAALIQDGAWDSPRSWYCTADRHLVTVASDGEAMQWRFDGEAFGQAAPVSDGQRDHSACGSRVG